MFYCHLNYNLTNEISLNIIKLLNIIKIKEWFMGKTIAEKIFDSHFVDSPFSGTYVLRLDRVFCHEITTPIAINDLIERNKDSVFDN